tara:strand:+ start:108 stop:527 length:420 start_codon:yes stop_codon:yes gene_type:complete
MKKLFSLSFIPVNADLGLLFLRVVFGGCMVFLHGWGKVTTFGSKFHSFPDPLGITHELSYLLATGGEFVGASLVVLGCYTRFAALSVAITMGVAFFMVHNGVLVGAKSGESALIYGAAFLALVFAGGGKYSVDAKIGNP